MTTIVPLVSAPAQTLSTVLAGQSVNIAVYMLGDKLYLDLSINGAAIVTAALCQDRVRLVREAYLGFSGDLAFIDTQGLSDPTYDGLGSRYQLVYLP